MLTSVLDARHPNGCSVRDKLLFPGSISGQFESSCRRIFVSSVCTSLWRTAKLKHLKQLETTGTKPAILTTLVLTVVLPSNPLHSLFKLQTQVSKDLRSRSKPTPSGPQLVANTERIRRVTRREPDRCQGEFNKCH